MEITVNSIEEKDQTTVQQYLAFNCGNEVYGIAVERVREVIEYAAVYSVPRTPAYIRGVINLRGEVLPVLDLSMLLYGRKSVVTPSTGIVFIEVQDRGETVLIGLVIGRVDAVVDMPVTAVNGVPEFSTHIDHRYVGGVGRDRGKFVILLKIDEVVQIDVLSRFGSMSRSDSKILH